MTELLTLSLRKRWRASLGKPRGTSRGAGGSGQEEGRIFVWTAAPVTQYRMSGKKMDGQMCPTQSESFHRDGQATPADSSHCGGVVDLLRASPGEPNLLYNR